MVPSVEPLLPHWVSPFVARGASIFDDYSPNGSRMNVDILVCIQFPIFPRFRWVCKPVTTGSLFPHHPSTSLVATLSARVTQDPCKEYQYIISTNPAHQNQARNLTILEHLYNIWHYLLIVNQQWKIVQKRKLTDLRQKEIWFIGRTFPC